MKNPTVGERVARVQQMKRELQIQESFRDSLKYLMDQVIRRITALKFDIMREKENK